MKTLPAFLVSWHARYVARSLLFEYRFVCRLPLRTSSADRLLVRQRTSTLRQGDRRIRVDSASLAGQVDRLLSARTGRSAKRPKLLRSGHRGETIWNLLDFCPGR